MSTTSPAEKELLTQIEDMSPAERKETFKRLNDERERIFFAYRSEFAEQIESELDDNEVDFQEFLEAHRRLRYVQENNYISNYMRGNISERLGNFCIKYPWLCNAGAPEMAEMIPSLVKFNDLQHEYLQKLQEEGLLDLELRYFSPSLGGMLGGDSDPAPAEIDIDDLPTSPSDLGDLVDEMLDQDREVNIRVPGGRSGWEDPKMAKFRTLFEWMEQNYRGPGYKLDSYLTIIRRAP